MIEGDAGSVHGLEVVSLVAQHLQTVLLHSLVVYQLGLQQTRCGETEGERISELKWLKKYFANANTLSLI